MIDGGVARKVPGAGVELALVERSNPLRRKLQRLELPRAQPEGRSDPDAQESDLQIGEARYHGNAHHAQRRAPLH